MDQDRRRRWCVQQNGLQAPPTKKPFTQPSWTTIKGRQLNPVHDEVFNLQDSGDVQVDLCDLARRQLRRSRQPQVLQPLNGRRRAGFPTSDARARCSTTVAWTTDVALATVFQQLAGTRRLANSTTQPLPPVNFNWRSWPSC